MRAQIKTIGGREAGTVYTIAEGEIVTIGRSLDNRISILDEKSSRKHSKIEAEADGFVISDLNSLNGTYLNGKTIVRRRLCHGDRVRVGSSSFEFLLEGRPPPLRGAKALVRPLRVIPRALRSKAVSRAMNWLVAASVALALYGVVSRWVVGDSGLDVASHPAAAMVFVDGKYVGQTPLGEITVPRGPHLVKVEKHGHVPFQRKVDVGLKSLRVEASLDALPTGTVDVTSRPVGAEVYLDGEYKGKTPRVIAGLPLGEHTLRVTRPEFLSTQETFRVSDGAPLKRAFELKQEMVQFYEDQIEREPNDASSLTELAHLHILAQRFEEAIESLEAAFAVVDRGEDSSNYASRLAQEVAKAYRVDHFDYGDFNAVAKLRRMIEEMLERVVERSPKQSNYKLLDQFYRQAGRTDKLNALYEKVYEKAPNDWEAAKNCGLGRLAAKDYESAKKLFDRARKSSPSSWETHYYYGYTCFLGRKSKKDLAEAIESYEKALRACRKGKERTTVLNAIQKAKAAN